MMMDPTVTSLLKQIPNRYMIVNVAAQLAREISEKAQREDLYLDDKPVSIALQDIAHGKVHIEMKAEGKENEAE